MISDNRRDMALTFLAQTDEPCASAQADYEALNNLKDQAKGGTAAERSEAFKDGSYEKHINLLRAAQFEFLKMKNRRMTESLIVECWRSENANRRQAGIL